MSGFIEALNSLSVHIMERERLENEARRAWSLMVVAALVLLGVQATADLFVFLFLRSVQWMGGFDPSVAAALVISAGGTGILAAALFGRLANRSLRMAHDSAERVALRHEDSPMRDRIRIAQWILLDTAFTRFCIAERAINGRIAQGIFLVAAWATLCVWLIVAAGILVQPVYNGTPLASVWAAWHMAILATFLVLAILSILLTRRWALTELGHAQHYGRQVQAFDRDFGGFLPRVERERVEKIVKARAGASAEDTAQSMEA